MVQEEGIPDSVRDSSLEETHKLPPAAMEGLLRAGACEPTRPLRRWAPPLAEEVQRALPQYEVTGFIARGGMGVVYKGVQRALNRAVAIKILPSELADDHLDFVGRFKREAQAMAALSHPNIVTVYEAGEAPEGLLYFTMEYIDGTDVGELVAEQGRLPQAEALRITSAVLAALECAHGRGIIHRDIKPSNVLINKQGEVKVADFGLAKVAAADGGLTQSVVTVGTPDFLAPETYIAGFALDQRADIYSAGVMLYKMLTGRVPRGRFDAPSGEVRGIDSRLDRIIDKAMQEDREKRYATAKEMRWEVEEAISKSLSEAHASVLPARTSSFPPAARGKRGLWIVATTLAAAAAGFMVWWSESAGSSQLEGANSKPAVTKADSSKTEPWVDMLQPDAAEKLQLEGIGKPGPEGLRVTVNGKAIVAGTEKPGRGDGALRFRTRFEVVTRSRLSVRARYNKNGLTYALMALTPDKIALQIWSGDGSTKTLKDFALTSPLVPGQEYQLELRAVGSTLTARLDGKTLGQVEDATIPEGAFMIGLGAGQPVTVRALDYLDLSTLGYTGPSAATSATPAAVSYPQWTKAFADLSKLPNLAEFTDGWARLSGSDGIRHIEDDAGNSLTLHNGGLRVKRRVPEKWHGGVLLHVRSLEGGRRLNLCYYEPKAPGELAHLQLRDFRPETLSPNATASQAWDAQKLLAEQRIPPVGTEIITELVVVGTTLMGRVGDHRIACTVEDTGKAGRLAIDETNTQFFRDVEVIAFDGMPEADALKLFGINGDAGKPATASADATAARWRDAFVESPLKEVIAKYGGTSQGCRLPENHHWMISPLFHRAGALRVRATSAGDKFVSLYIAFDDRTLKRVRFRPGDNKWMLSRGLRGPDEMDFAASSGSSPFDGKPHELLFARFGGRLLTMLDGQLLHDEADESATPGGFVLDIYPDAEIVAHTVEYLNLDGVPEDEALRLLGIKND